MSVLRALAEPEREGQADGNQAEGPRIGRRGVFRLSAGAGIAAALLVTGRVPAFAAHESRALAAGRNWAQANQSPRVGQYDELARFSVAYRPAIFAALSPGVRSRLWVEQVARYRRAHANMTVEQARVLDDFEAIVADEATYTREDPAIQARMKAIEAGAVAAFGRSEACGLMSTLGPLDTAGSSAVSGNSGASAPAATCNCNRGSDCSVSCVCVGCTSTWPGCGCGWVWTCNGMECA
ncbi:bacteriocin fulvocin C-related protein [Streptomyces griseoloalbus]|uniref:bacteriocin fulvocin C-related protein n=1 Tax=Streptomyces griseoloalbus TaxID=67303 RepID=UPI0033A0841E